MSQANLALAARPDAAAQILAAGGGLPNLSQAVAAAASKEMEDLMKSATASASAILQAATAKTTDQVNQKTALQVSLVKVDEAIAELKRARDYFNATNNIFPLQKLLGVPTTRDVLARFPDIDKIPEGWTVPAAPATAG